MNFKDYLCIIGQLELNSQIVAHVERLASLYGVTQLLNQCQEFIQRSRTPDSQVQKKL